jgi:hypothetical protein
MLNCKQATALMSKGMDKKLGILQRSSLRFHLIKANSISSARHQTLYAQSATNLHRHRHGKAIPACLTAK